MKNAKLGLLAIVAISAHVANASSTSAFYLGADVGATEATSIKNKDKNPFYYDSNETRLHSADVAYGIKAGYKFSPNFALEGSLNQFVTKASAHDFGEKYPWVKLRAKGGTVAGKSIFPVGDNADIYGKVGVAVVENTVRYFDSETGYKVNPIDGYKDFNDKKVSTNLLVGVGAEYSFDNNLSLTTEYQYINKSKLLPIRFSDDDQHLTVKRSSPSYHSISLGLNYYFGSQPKKAAPPVLVENLESITLNNDVLFGFNKHTLKPEAQGTLNDLANKINDIRADQKSIQIAGYADRIGSQEYNLKLSERRANSVAENLGSRGITDISAVGHGSSNPVTGNQCDGVKGKKALIECLAPDRRVEINVKGIKK